MIRRKKRLVLQTHGPSFIQNLNVLQGENLFFLENPGSVLEVKEKHEDLII